MSKLNNKYFETLKRERKYNGYRKVDSIVLNHKSLNPASDKWLCNIQREVICMQASAATLLYEPKEDVILLSKQFRVAPALIGYDIPFMLECSAGQIDAGEKPEDAAIREAFEETGAKILDLEFIVRALPSSGATTEEFYIYCGHIESIPEGRYHGMIEEGEEIETIPMPVSEVVKLVDDGKIHNATALIALNWFFRHHDRLRDKWK